MSRGPGARVPLPSRSGKDRAREARARAALSRRRDAPAAAPGDGDPHDAGDIPRAVLHRGHRLAAAAPDRRRPPHLRPGLVGDPLPLLRAAKPRLHLGTLFLALDIPAFVWVIYQTGADNSWLFFLLYIRVADQTNTTFKRALAFSHIAVASYALLIPCTSRWSSTARSRGRRRLFKLLILYAPTSTCR